MNIFKFDGTTVRYYWYTDHKLYFTANSAFHAFGFKGWYNYMQRHGGDFMLPEQGDPDYPYTYAVSWDGLLRFPKNCKDSARSNNWWIDNHLAYEAFIRNIKKFVLLEKQEADTTDKKVAVVLDSPAHKHPATVAALQSLPKAKLPPLDVPEAAPFTAPVQSNNISGAVYTPALDDFAKTKPAQASPTQQLFSKVTATLNRHKGGEDSFPRIRDYWNESTEEAVALKMALLKIARIENGISVEDSYVDAIGYLVLAYNKYKEQEQ